MNIAKGLDSAWEEQGKDLLVPELPRQQKHCTKCISFIHVLLIVRIALFPAHATESWDLEWAWGRGYILCP